MLIAFLILVYLIIGLFVVREVVRPYLHRRRVGLDEYILTFTALAWPFILAVFIIVFFTAPHEAEEEVPAENPPDPPQIAVMADDSVPENCVEVIYPDGRRSRLVNGRLVPADEA